MSHAYFDHNATAPLRPEVLQTFCGALAEVYGNASSIHQPGQVAKQQLETARRQVAAMLGASPREIVFTSGGTEADNLAILGAVRADRRTAKHVITTAIEHPAVLNPCGRLERDGVAVTYLPVDGDCRVDPDAVRRALRPETVLISVMHANNETGTLQPLAEIARVAREAGVLFHSDGVQAAGKVAGETVADLYAISGHKLGAPKGIGALFVRKGTSLEPIQFGGRHERELRPGTENVPAAIALGKAASMARPGGVADLRDRLEAGILEQVPGTGVNGSRTSRLPNTTNVYFDGITGESMVISLDLRGFAVSTGSACSSGAVEPSHVLIAMGLSRDRARSSIRFSLGPSNSVEQVDALIEAVAASAAQLRRLSPTYV